MNDIELGYTAGVIDADGSIGIAKQNGIYRVVVQLTDKAGLITSWLRKHFGGTITYYQSSNSFIPGRYYYKWALTNNKAKDFISLIEPYLVEKKLQAQAIVNFPTFARGQHPTVAERIMREAIYNKVKELNQA